jgi:hypothetical protein
MNGVWYDTDPMCQFRETGGDTVCSEPGYDMQGINLSLEHAKQIVPFQRAGVRQSVTVNSGMI